MAFDNLFSGVLDKAKHMIQDATGLDIDSLEEKGAALIHQFTGGGDDAAAATQLADTPADTETDTTDTETEDTTADTATDTTDDTSTEETTDATEKTTDDASTEEATDDTTSDEIPTKAK